MTDIKNGFALITGTTSGVGLNTVKPLLKYGWNVIAVNRSNKRAEQELNKILTNGEMKNVSFVEMDLSDLDDVRDGSK